jgi:hypothetical protein
MSWTDVGMLLQILVYPFEQLGSDIARILPGLLIAILIGVLGYIVSQFVGIVLSNFFTKIKLDTLIEGSSHHKSIGSISLSRATAGLIKWYLFALFLFSAFHFIPIDAVSKVLIIIAQVIPQLLLATVIFMIGLIFADVLYNRMSRMSNVVWVKILNPVVKILVILAFVYLALLQVEVVILIVGKIMLILVLALVLAAAIAIGISLGFVMRKDVESGVKELKSHFK